MAEMLLKNLKDVHDKDGRDGTPLGDLYARECVSMGAELFDWKNVSAEQEASRQEEADATASAWVWRWPPTARLWRPYRYQRRHPEDERGQHSGHVQRKLRQWATAWSPPGPADQRYSDIPGEGYHLYPGGSTRRYLYDWGNFSSRGTYVCGAAAGQGGQGYEADASGGGRKAASGNRTDPADGRAWSLNYPGTRSATLEELAAHARHKSHRDLVAAVNHASNGMAVSYGAHFVKVQVDTETGEVKPLDYVVAMSAAPSIP